MEHDDHMKSEPELLKDLHEHAIVYENFGRQIEGYIEKVQTMTKALGDIHKSILLLADHDWSRIQEFSLRLEDQEALWSVMADDIQKIGPGFAKHGEQFKAIQESLKKRKDQTTEYRRMKNEFEKMVKSPRLSKKQKFEAKKILERKEIECDDANEDTKSLLEQSEISKRQLVVTTYGKFLGAHAEFCEQSLQVYEAIPDILKGFLPKSSRSGARR